jgi:hypothetical protein
MEIEELVSSRGLAQGGENKMQTKVNPMQTFQ